MREREGHGERGRWRESRRQDREREMTPTRGGFSRPILDTTVAARRRESTVGHRERVRARAWERASKGVRESESKRVSRRVKDGGKYFFKDF